MDIKSYFQTKQPDLYLILKNSFLRSSLSHAYLLAGSKNQPLFELGEYFAKSFFCENADPFPCDECKECLRFEHHHQIGFFFLDGSVKTISKEDIQELISSTKTGNSEKNGKIVILIHKIENMTLEAINSFLKFLEEPLIDTFFILTTVVINQIIPTIVSRTIVLNLKPEQLLERPDSLGLSLLDYYLLRNDYDQDAILRVVKSKEYLSLKTILLQVLEGLEVSLQQFAFNNRVYFIDYLDAIKETKIRREATRQYLDLLFASLVMIEFYGKTFIDDPFYDKIMKIKEQNYPLKEFLLKILKTKGRIDLNLKETLCIDRMFISFGE